MIKNKWLDVIYWYSIFKKLGYQPKKRESILLNHLSLFLNLFSILTTKKKERKKKKNAQTYIFLFFFHTFALRSF